MIHFRLKIILVFIHKEQIFSFFKMNKLATQDASIIVPGGRKM